MALSGRAWPAHPKPLDDELLSSWLVRTARANGLKLQTFCDTVFGKEHQLWNRDIDRSAPEWLQAAMSEHTGTSQERVRQTTLDIYRGRIYHRRNTTGQLRWILSAGIYHRTRRYFGMQYCPQCLSEDEEPYFRTRWRVAALILCPIHRICLHDRCSACAAPVIFHRRELGRPSTTDGRSLSLCYACHFDLRLTARNEFIPYDTGAGLFLDKVAEHIVGINSGIDIEHLDVLHQLCKVMVSRRKSSKLVSYVSSVIGVSELHPVRNRQTFEWRSIDERRHLLQLASWIMASLDTRILDSWNAKAANYSDFVRDFRTMPAWFESATAKLFTRRC